MTRRRENDFVLKSAAVEIAVSVRLWRRRRDRNYPQEPKLGIPGRSNPSHDAALHHAAT